MATETKTFYPQAYDTSDYAFDSISGPTNPVGKGSSNESVYAEIHLTKGAKASTYISWPFNCSAIPKNATIDSVECKVATSISSISATYITEKWMKLYSGITAKGSHKNITGNTRGVYTLDCGNWTREELQSCNLYFFAKRGSSSTSTDRYISFYGADLTVTYTYQSEKFMLKLGGAYNDIARVFKKVNGIWVEQEELANVVDQTKRLVNGGEYVPPLISFTLTSSVWYATQGMTWARWCESEYNNGTQGWHVASNGYVTVNTESMWVVDANGSHVKGTDAIIADHTYKITPTEPVNLISFTIAGTSYQAEEGMTWGEWVASSYNTGGFSVVADLGGDLIDNGSIIVTHSGGKPVLPDAVIKENYAYS